MYIAPRPPKEAYSPPTIRDQIFKFCKSYYKYVKQDSFTDKSGSWIYCSNQPQDKPHWAISYGFNYDGTILDCVRIFTVSYESSSLSSTQLFK